MKQRLAQLCYWCGDVVSRPMERYDLGILYPVYNWFMTMSFRLDTNHQVWHPPE